MWKQLLNLPATRLKRLVAIKQQIDKLESEVESLLIEVSPAPLKQLFQKKRVVSAATRKKIAAATKARWARMRSKKSQ